MPAIGQILCPFIRLILCPFMSSAWPLMLMIVTLSDHIVVTELLIVTKTPAY